MADLPPNVNWLEDAAETCKTGKRVALERGGQVYIVRVSKHDPELHGDAAEQLLTDGGEDG